VLAVIWVARIKGMGNYVAGVEFQKKAAVVARQAWTKFYVFDTEKDWPEELLKDRFDLVIMAEFSSMF